MARHVELFPAKPCWLLLGLGGLACSVDARELRLGSEAGAPDVGATSSVGATSNVGATSKVGGNAAESGGSKLVNGCADLDTDAVADCAVTLVENATFQSDVASWTAADAASLAWDSQNALSDEPSGCALLQAAGASDLDGDVLYRAVQCVPVAENQVVIAYANAWVSPGAAAEDAAKAEVEVSFFDDEGCSGEATGRFFTPPSAASAWVTIQAGGLSGPATSSAMVALVGIKPNRAAALSVRFDNVMVKAKAL